jgi:signal transduction histidine kinase
MRIFNRVKLSLYFKLTLIVIIWGVLINLSIFIYTRYSSDLKSPHMFPIIMDRLSEYMAKDIGYPPDTTKAKQFAEELKLSIRYISPEFNWATSWDVPTVEDLKSDKRFVEKFDSRNPVRAKFEDRGYAVIKDPRGLYIVGIPLPEESLNIQRALIMILIMTSVILLSLYFVIRKLLSPVKKLVKVVEDIGAGNFDVELNTKRRDEFGDLARSIDSMKNNLKELINSKEQLLIDVSHELRTPLTRVKLGLALNSPPEKINEDIKEIEFLISSLLEGYKNDIALLKENFYISDLVETIKEENEIYKDRVEVINHTDKNYSICADIQKVIIILRNLIQNSIKYSEPGSKIKVTINSKPPFTEFTVEDSGIGIDESEKEKIFEPFYRSDLSRSKKTGGYGLGLYIVKRYVALHEGQITVDSELGKGTKITFTIKNS